MPYLQNNIPHFKCWVRREYTHNHEKHHGDYLHAMAIAVTTVPDRCLSFQMIFTGCESDFMKVKTSMGALCGQGCDYSSCCGHTIRRMA